MLQRATLIIVLSFVFYLHTSAVRSNAFDSPRISLDRPVHFSAPNGSDVLTAPGDYKVKAGWPGLQLTPELAGDGRDFLIDAIVADIDMDAHEPVAMAVRVREDEYHIILLMPDRKVHEAVGSSSGILTRGIVYKPLTAEQIKAALARKRIASP